MIPILCDGHFGARNDSPVFREYFKRFFDHILFPYLDQNQIKKILYLGDLWDRRKYVNIETLKFFRESFFEPLERRGILLVCLLGNHDVYYKNTSEVNSVRELCDSYSNIRIVSQAIETTEFADTKILLVPWINDVNREETLNLIKTTDAKVVMGHLEVEGFTMHHGHKCEDGLSAEMFSRFDLVCSGHFHHRSNIGNIHYLGAMYEMSFSDVGEPHGINVWDPKTNCLTFVDNPYKMFHRLYYNDRGQEFAKLLKKVTDRFTGCYVKLIVEQKTNPYYFERFLEKLLNMNPADVKIEDNSILIETEEEINLDAAEDTLSILGKYVDGLEIETDKSKLKEDLRLLYVEASTME